MSNSLRVAGRVWLVWLIFASVLSSCHGQGPCEEKSDPDDLRTCAESIRSSDPAASQRVYARLIPLLPLEQQPRARAKMAYNALRFLPDVDRKTEFLQLREATLKAETYKDACGVVQGKRFESDIHLRNGASDLTQIDTLLDAAVDALEACGNDIDRARTWLLVAQLRRLQGRQLEQFRAAREAARYAAEKSQEALFARFEMVELQHDLGDITDGGERYLELLPLAEMLEATEKQLDILMSVASLYRDLAQFDQARRYLQQAQRLVDINGDDDGYDLMIRTNSAWVEVEAGRLSEAISLIESVPAAALAKETPRRRHLRTIVEGFVRLEQGWLEDAEVCFLSVARDPAAEPELRWRARDGRARVAERRGAALEVRALLWDAISELEAQRQKTASEFLSLAYLSQREDLYLRWLEALLSAWRKEGQRPSTSQSRGWEAAKVFSSGALTADDLLAAVEKVSSQELTTRLYRDKGGLEQSDSLDLTHSWSLNLPGQWPAGAALREQLDPNDRVLIFQPLRQELLILEVRKSGVDIFTVNISGRELKGLVQEVRRAFYDRSLDPQPALEELGARILGPIRARLPGKEQELAFVLQGDLASIPVQALRLEKHYLVEQVTPFELPNLSSIRALSGKKPPKRTLKALAVAAGGRLPSARSEAQLLRRPGFETLELTGEDATQARVKAAMAGKDVIHFSGHGSAPVAGEPESGHRMSPAHLLLHDGRLNVNSLQSMRLDARLVVLSGCETQVGQASVFEPGYGGLYRAVLAAGAEAVIASRWKVDDQATLALMRRFYEQYPQQTPAVALARAQRALLSSAGSIETVQVRQMVVESVDGKPAPPVPLSSPWCWAGFSLVGRGN